MRIGFRFDEFKRLERFFNNSDPTNFSIPVNCSTRGKKRMRHGSFNWRNCTFPLIENGIVEADIKDYWAKENAKTLFPIDFPVISNCVGCFHKKPETLCVMANLHPAKIEWFSRQEEKDMGVWLDSRITYRQIIEGSENYIPEMIKKGASCDSGGCHD